MSRPIWQLPVRDTNTGENDIAHNAKYHCFEDGVSLCGKYTQVTKFFKNDIESGEIAMRPEIACKVCRKKWMKRFQVES